MAEVARICYRPLQPVSDPRLVGLGKMQEFFPVTCWNHVDDIIPAPGSDRRNKRIAIAEIVPVPPTKSRVHHSYGSFVAIGSARFRYVHRPLCLMRGISGNEFFRGELVVAVPIIHKPFSVGGNP